MGSSRLIAWAMAGAIAVSICAGPASAGSVKIGMITTLSGGGASLGIDIRDGFRLAIEMAGGRLGGAETKLIVVDDARKVGNAKQIAVRMLEDGSSTRFRAWRSGRANMRARSPAASSRCSPSAAR